MQWHDIKPETPVLGIDDSGFRFSRDQPIDQWQEVPVYGVAMRGNSYIDGIVQTQIPRDASDPTPDIIQMVQRSKQYEIMRAVLHSGLTIGGFGVLDLDRMHEDLGIPIITVARREPDYAGIKKALFKHFDDAELRWEKLSRHGKPQKVPEKPIYLHCVGIDFEMACKLIEVLTRVGYIPECLRISHLIGASNYHYQELTHT